MTPQEFKAWFDGFTEAFDRVPTKAQWARVKERVAEIDGKPVTERMYIDRYWPIYNQLPVPYPSYWTNVAGWNLQQAPLNMQQATQNYQGLAQNNPFISSNAMYALGKADAQSLTVGG